MRGAERGEEGAREEAWVGRDFGGERERACSWARFSRRGLVWACFSPATDDENYGATEGAPHEVLRGEFAGEGVTCTWASGVHVGERGDHVHSAGACRAGQAGRAEQVRPAGLAGQVGQSRFGLQRRSGLCKG